MSVDPFQVINEVVNVENNVADFIQNGPPDGLAGYVRDKYRERCREFANAPAWARLLANAPAGTLGRLCRPYLDDNGWDSPVFEPPFAGGQCPGVSYDVTWDRQAPGINPPPGSARALGPISISTALNPGDEGANCPPGTEFKRFTLLSNGNPVSNIYSGCGVSYSNFQVVRRDGQPDSCGDPPPQLEPGPNPPPNPGPLPGPDPTENPDNPTGPPLIPIPPYDDPIFGPVPVQPPPAVGVPDLPGDPTNGPGDPDAIDDPIPGGPGTPNEDGGVDFGAPPSGRAWVGAFVQVDYPDDAGTVPNTAPVNAVFTRTVGNVSLKHGTAYSTAVRLSSEWSAIFRGNDNLTVDGCKVNVLPSFSYRVYPVSVETCPENTCTIAEV